MEKQVCEILCVFLSQYVKIAVLICTPASKAIATKHAYH